MLTPELKQFVEEQYKRLKKYFDIDDLQTIILSGTVKLSEEMGELCTQILSFHKLNRKEKANNHNKKKLEEEFADVLITTLILAHAMDADIEKGLQKKIDVVIKRFST